MKFLLLVVLSVIASTYNGLAIEDNPKPVYIVKELEISDEVAVKLCKKLKRQEDIDSTINNVFNTSYLWVQVRHQVAGKPNGIVLDAPLLPAGCLKWKLRRCCGTEVWPLMRPCTYWDPIRKNTKQCRSTHTKTYKYVMGRPPGAVPGNCMCDLPCEEKYDPYQVCRAELNTVPTRTEPQKPVEVSLYQALQLCRSVTTSKAMGERMGVLLNWLPIRIQNAMSPDPNDDNRRCPYTWVYTPCENGTQGIGCGDWDKFDEDTPCESVAPGKPAPFPELKTDTPCVRNEFPFPPCPDSQRVGKSNTVTLPSTLDGICHCHYPCLPFFDPINQCYFADGQPMRGKNNKPILLSKNYGFSDERGIIRCTLWEEEIKCGVIPPYVSSRPTPILPESTPQERRSMRARRIRKK